MKMKKNRSDKVDKNCRENTGQRSGKKMTECEWCSLKRRLSGEKEF